jgi:hypothetical protein
MGEKKQNKIKNTFWATALTNFVADFVGFFEAAPRPLIG